MTSIAWRLTEVRAAVANACRAAGRDPASVTLIAVSKKHPTSAIREAFAAGQRVFGESYAAELRAKQDELADLAIEWHFVGHLQRNKMRKMVGKSALLHGIDDEPGIEELQRRCAANAVTQDVLLQVNLSGEPSKNGCTEDEIDHLVDVLSMQDDVHLRGLMTMPAPGVDARPTFARLRAIRDRLQRTDPAIAQLSMGMTGDFPAAIEQGATHVRIGTAIFGAR